MRTLQGRQPQLIPSGSISSQMPQGSLLRLGPHVCNAETSTSSTSGWNQILDTLIQVCLPHLLMVWEQIGSFCLIWYFQISFLHMLSSSCNLENICSLFNFLSNRSPTMEGHWNLWPLLTESTFYLVKLFNIHEFSTRCYFGYHGEETQSQNITSLRPMRPRTSVEGQALSCLSENKLGRFFFLDIYTSTLKTEVKRLFFKKKKK